MKDKSRSVWHPLRNKLFFAVWSVTVISNTGTWMQNVGSSWLMTSLNASPFLVALVQAASSAPIALLALPAGALADIADRRRYLLATQIWMFFCSLGLALLTLMGEINSDLLLAFTFLLGCGSAMSMPAWGAVIPELVKKDDLPAAITLNGLGMNVSRAIGPALAGLLINLYGADSVFFSNTLSFLGVIAVLALWKRKPNKKNLPAERLFQGIRSGLRYARYSHILPCILFRGAAFFISASALWAMLPLIVSRRLHAGSGTFGLLMAFIGIGAVLSAIVLPAVRSRIGLDNLVRLATIVYALTLWLLATQTNIYYLYFGMLVTGSAWISVMSSLQVAAQGSLPEWVRARGLSVFMMVFMSGMAGGSLLWGYVAGRLGLEASLLLSAAAMVLGILATWSYSIAGYEGTDLTPSMHWPLPAFEGNSQFDRGPVLVTLEYKIAGHKLKDFRKLILKLKKVRRRDGAYFWELFQDTSQPDIYFECFMVESWLEHLRQHERISNSDRVLQDCIDACLTPGVSKKISHYIAAL